ncbi:MAG: branched-chain amino acid ABC transporter permease [Micromonosporaceae bacterium]|nr:branched-chain amino acid ABC transporter permease [Micromonosporaceae bacterium]
MVDFFNLIDHLGEHTINGLSKGSIYGLVALGYTLVYGVLQLINFAHAEVFMVGTWTVLGVYTVLGVSEDTGPVMVAVALVVALVAACLVSATTALGLERIAYRPLRRRRAPRLIFLITAIGCSLALMEVFGYVLKVFFGAPFGRGTVHIPTLVRERPVVALGDTSITNVQVIIIVSALLMLVGLDQFINRTRLGRGVRAVAQDPDTASLMGVNKNRVFMLIFVLGGLMAGAAALLFTMRFSITKFDIGFVLGLKAFTAAVLGGIGNLRGALLGGLTLGVVEVYSSSLISSNWEDVTAFVVLVVVLMFRPTGILGESLGKARA